MRRSDGEEELRGVKRHEMRVKIMLRAVDAEFLSNPMPVDVDGALADIEHAGNLLCVPAFFDQGYNLQFSWGKVIYFQTFHKR